MDDAEDARMLWCAVLENAIQEASGIVVAEFGSGRDLAVRRARDYLLKPNGDFNIVCSLAGLDPIAVRERLVKQLGRLPAPSPQPPKRTTRCYLFEGKSLTLTEWAAETGIPRAAIAARLELGWPLERALTEPSGHKVVGNKASKLYRHDGESLTLDQWGERTGMTPAALTYRMRHGMTPSEAFTTPRMRAASPARPGGGQRLSRP
jgi:hypothetical protein